MQATMTYQKSNPFKTLFVLAAFAVIVLAVGYAISDGPDRHPGEAEQVRTCLNQNGTLQIWDESNNRQNSQCLSGGTNPVRSTNHPES